jgi:hypothetical protein
MRWERLWTGLLDAAIVTVLVGFAATFLALRAEQHRDDAAAEEIAAWAQSRGVTRIAWPVARRGAVPRLRADGITPVLYEPAIAAAQNAAVNDTPIVVVDDPADLDVTGIATGQTMQAGELRAVGVDLEAAAAAPVPVGRAVGQELSRPFVYAPIADPARFTADEPFRVDFVLTAGSYRLAVAVFDPVSGEDGNASTEARVSLTSGGRVVFEDQEPLEPLVLEPFERTVRIEGAAAGPVTLEVRLVGRAGAPRGAGYLHAWSVERSS